MLINLTNHPSSKWSSEQMGAAVASYEEVVDYAFPIVSPIATEHEIYVMANAIVDDILRLYGTQDVFIHVMGELTLCYCLIRKFTEKGIHCVASTTERIVTEHPDGTKTSTFKFVQFREY